MSRQYRIFGPRMDSNMTELGWRSILGIKNNCDLISSREVI